MLKPIGKRKIQLNKIFVGGDSYILSDNEPTTLLKDFHHIESIREFEEDRPLRRYTYYKKKLGAFNHFSNKYFTDFDAKLITRRNKELYRSIRDNGFKEEDGYFINKAGLPDGQISVIEFKKGKYAIIDGYHRTSCLYVLGYRSVNILVFNKEK